MNIYVSQREQLVRIGKKNRYFQEGDVFVTEEPVGHPYVKAVTLRKGVKEEKLQYPKVIAALPDGTQTLIQSEPENGVIAFWLVNLKARKYLLEPLSVDKARKFFEDCPPAGRKLIRFPEVLKPGEPVQQGAKLGDPRNTAYEMAEQNAIAQESKAKLEREVTITWDQRQVWETHKSEYPGLTENDFAPTGELY